MSAPAVVLSQRLDGPIAWVTLNRPEVRNAVNAERARALEAVVLELEADEQVWAVVLTGAGPGLFCAALPTPRPPARRSSHRRRSARTAGRRRTARSAGGRGYRLPPCWRQSVRNLRGR